MLGRDTVLYFHIIIGILLLLLPISILYLCKPNSPWRKPLSFLTALCSWLILLPAGRLYLVFYPATKTLIKAGPNPWLHGIIMETKEHWGILLPLIATTAAIMTWKQLTKENKKWWILVIILTILLGIMGRMITAGASA
ncbi:MAG: hypothetical protein Q7R96_00125 [Nanoarchaeota archaeon]|nr:hypothetical protein [Nanoarchaeota archaeon]